MMNPVAITRSTFLTNTEDARNKGSLPKRKAAFDPVLPFVELKHQIARSCQGLGPPWRGHARRTGCAVPKVAGKESGT
jgi:hypothetical protein